MKASELKQLIREEVRKVVSGADLASSTPFDMSRDSSPKKIPNQYYSAGENAGVLDAANLEIVKDLQATVDKHTQKIKSQFVGKDAIIDGFQVSTRKQVSGITGKIVDFALTNSTGLDGAEFWCKLGKSVDKDGNIVKPTSYIVTRLKLR